MSIPGLDGNTLISLPDCPKFGCRIPFDGAHIVTQSFANTQSSGFRHRGLDLIKSDGTINGSPLLAAQGGQVTHINTIDWSYGGHVLVNHGLYADEDGRVRAVATLYAHLSSANVHVGQIVKQGDVIGWADNTGLSTGSHLHWEVRYDGYRVSPLTQVREPVVPQPPPPPDPWEEYWMSLDQATKDALTFVAQQQIKGDIVYAGAGKTALIAIMDGYGANTTDAQKGRIKRRLERLSRWLGAENEGDPSNVMERINATLSLPGDPLAPVTTNGEGIPAPEDDGRDE